jgi:hypothetical protein
MKPIKLTFAIVWILYFLWVASNPSSWSFFDNLDLAIHETGHLVFRPFGEFMSIAGGSIFQIAFPATFIGYFIWQKSYYSAAIIAVWIGQSILNVYVYANDSIVMQLPLTSGMTGSEGGFHDWNYLLTELNLIHKTQTVAKIIRFTGTLVIIVSGILSIYFAINSKDDEWEETI